MYMEIKLKLLSIYQNGQAKIIDITKFIKI